MYGIVINEEWIEAIVAAYVKRYPEKAKAHARDMSLTRKKIRLTNPKAMSADGTSMMVLDIPLGVRAVIRAIDPKFQCSRSKTLKRYFGVRPK